MLEYGKKYKYPALCKALGIEEKKGGYKKRQIQKLNKEYEMVSKGEYFIIKHKYEDYELAENSPYHKTKMYLEPMLYTLLSQAPNNVLRFDMKELLQITAVVNQDYHFAKWHIEEVDKFLTDEKTDLKIFIEETEPMYKRIIMEILKDMESRKFIKITEIPMYGKKYKGTDGKTYTQVVEASDFIGKPAFLEAQRQAMLHFGLEHWEDMRILDYYQRHEAVKIMEEYLKKELGVSFFYYEYELILNRKGINEMITDNFSEMRTSFNEYIQNKTLGSKNNNLMLINDNNRLTYVKALIDTNVDLGLRNKEEFK